MERSTRSGQAPGRGSGGRALLLLLMLAWACRAPQEPGPLQLGIGVESAVEQHAGALLAGSVRSPEVHEVDPDPADALVLRFELHYVEDLPPTTLPPLATRTRLVAAVEHPAPVLATPAFHRDAHSGAGPEAVRLREELEAGLFGRQRLLAEHEAALPADSTAVLVLSSRPPPGLELQVPGLADGPLNQVFFHVSRAGDELGMSIGRRDVMRVRPMEATGPADVVGLDVDTDSPRFLQHELMLLADAPEVDGAPLALIVPSSYPGDGRAFLFLISLASPPDPGTEPEAAAAHAQAMEVCLERVAANAALARERAEPGSVEAARRRGIADVLAGLDEVDEARATVVALASGAGARAALDLALTADADSFRTFAQRIASELAPAMSPEGELALGWMLDRAALAFLAREQILGDERPEFDALLLVHTGQVGRYPGSVLEHLDQSGRREDFEAWLLKDNLDLLMVPDASERVRAFDWLQQRGAAPEGYQPLAPEEERRAAVDAARVASEELAAEADAEAGDEP